MSHKTYIFAHFSLVHLSFVSLICRAPAGETRRAEGKKDLFFLPYPCEERGSLSEVITQKGGTA